MSCNSFLSIFTSVKILIYSPAEDLSNKKNRVFCGQRYSPDQRWAKGPIDRSSDTDSIFRLYQTIQSVDVKFRFLNRPIVSARFEFWFFNRPILFLGHKFRFLYRPIVSVCFEFWFFNRPILFLGLKFRFLYRPVVSVHFEFRFFNCPILFLG